MVEIATAVKDHLLDTLLDRPLGNQLADFLGRGHVAASLDLGGESGGGEDGLALGVVDDLGIDVVQRAINVQPWTLRGALHLLANAKVHALANFVSLSQRNHLVVPFLKAGLPCSSVRSLLGAGLADLLLQTL